MSGILVYTKEQAQRNAFAVAKFQNELGVKLVLPDYSGSADFVINRTNDPEVGRRFEQKGIRVFNCAGFSALANDKEKCYRFMERNGIPILPIDYRTVPLVVKPKHGSGGQGVRLITDPKDIPAQNNALVFQKAAGDPGKDLRVWVLGGQIVTAIMRLSKTDFRANYCLGGSAVPYTLRPNEKQLVQKIISLVDGDYYGVDFLFDGGRIVLNELEDTVGARMVYDKTNIDILKRYCNYIKSVL